MPRCLAQLVSCLLIALAGCATDHPHVAMGVYSGPPAWTCPSTWGVLPGPLYAGGPAADSGLAWAHDRRNASLSPRPVQPVLATTCWPEPPRPTLERPRSVRTVRSPEVYIFYRTERRHHFHRHDFHRYDFHNHRGYYRW